MKRTEVSLFRNGKPVRGILEQFEATDQTFVTSGNADGTTSTLNFTNSTGGTFTVTNSNLLFNTGGGGVTDVTGTAPVVSSGGDTPAISVTTAAVTNGSVNLSTGDQIYDFVAGFTAPAANRVVVTADEGTDATMYPTFVSAAGTVPLYNYGTLTYNPGDANLSSTNFTGALAGNASTSTKIASITNTDIVQLGSTQTLTNKTLTSPTITGPDITGTANLDAVDIDGNVQLDGTLTVGVDDTGYDVKFFGATAGKYMLWDEDQDSLFFPDDTKIVLGTGSDTEIQQTGSETIIKDASTGNIKLRAGTVTIQNGGASKTMGVFNGANSVDLHYNNAKKFETTNTGVNVTGNMVSTGTVQGGKLSNIASPATALDIHHDPTSLGNNTGGGEVVTFGTASGSLTAGKLYYLNTSGVWTLTQANASSSNGNSQLLGIALGATVGAGILLRGFFDMNSYLTGTFNEGISLYVCETTAGNINVAAPGAANQFIRVVGYATSTSKVIYFNPDGTYITLS